MVTTDDPELAARLKRLREHGMNVSAADRHAAGKPIAEQYLEVGFNYRMTDVQAVNLSCSSKLDAMVARRRELAGITASWLESPVYGRWRTAARRHH